MEKLTDFPWDKQPWLDRAGLHSSENVLGLESEVPDVPGEEDRKLVFALLEALDFQCFEYQDAPPEPTRAQAIKWLKENKKAIEAISVPTPSQLGKQFVAEYLEEG